MKLLLDQNLPWNVARQVADLYPESRHVIGLGMDDADDTAVWRFAKNNGYVIVTKDADFDAMAQAWGHPPKVVWVKLGNCSAKVFEATLRSYREQMEAFVKDADKSVLCIPAP
jgi:predicted nuclease of predicted toxin-antitoxin system